MLFQGRYCLVRRATVLCVVGLCVSVSAQWTNDNGNAILADPTKSVGIGTTDYLGSYKLVTATDGNNHGLLGQGSGLGNGVTGVSTNGSGVVGQSGYGEGVLAQGGRFGVAAYGPTAVYASGSEYDFYGVSGNPSYFAGNVDIGGRAKTGGFQMPTGASVNYVLTCDNTSGNALWKPGLWSTNGTDVYRSTGNVGIGIANPGEKLEVDGTVKCVAVKINNSWTIRAPDYVFEDSYKLRNISDVEEFVKTKKHLPEVPSAAEMKKNGVDVAEINMALLKKVEELTLYVIEVNKKLNEQNRKVAVLEKMVVGLK